MSVAGQQRVDWSTAPPVWVVIPTCPKCGCDRYRKVRTESAGEGAFTKKVICCDIDESGNDRGCGQPYKIIMELPELGNGDFHSAIM